MPNIERLGHDAVGGRDLYSLNVTAPDELPAKIRLSSGYFVCLLAWDSAAESVEVISRVAESILGSGCVYLCSWGEGCERVHDIFDEVAVGPDPDPGDAAVMTTWHRNETLDEALWFFLNSTSPDDRYEARCDSAVAVSIGGDRSRAERILFALSVPQRFNAEVLRQENDQASG